MTLPYTRIHPVKDESEDAVRVLLRSLGEDIGRDGLLETPRRVVKAMRELTAGYNVDVAKLLTTTFEMDRPIDQLVVTGGIRVVSLCEHHMLPFTGSAVVGYLPVAGRVVGLSKIARVVDAFARRLQVQERLTEEIADAIWDNLVPSGVGVVIRAHHSCMGIRGANQPTAIMTTSALRGVLLDKPAARAEFMALAGDLS